MKISRLKFVRKFRNITQEELGILMGFNKSNAKTRIYQYESGYRIPSDEYLRKISRLTGTSEENYIASENENINLIKDLMWAEIVGDIEHEGLVVNFKNNLYVEEINNWNRKYEEYQSRKISYHEYLRYLLVWPQHL